MRSNKKQFKDMMILENSQDLHTIEICNRTLNTLENHLEALCFDVYDLNCLVTYGKTPEELRWEAEQDFYASVLYDSETRND